MVQGGRNNAKCSISMTVWHLWLYPELRDVPQCDRDRIWRLAKEESFCPGENILILASVGAAAVVVRYVEFDPCLEMRFSDSPPTSSQRVSF